MSIDTVPSIYDYCPFCAGKLGTRIEEEKPRQHCEHCNWTYYPHVAASVSAIIEDLGAVLLVKRLHEPFKGTWMFPSGFVDFGEHPDEALEREVNEETGLKVRDCDLLGVYQSPDDYREPGHFVFFYRVKAGGGELRTDPHENEDIRWFPIGSEMPSVGWKLHSHFLSLIWKLGSSTLVRGRAFKQTAP